MGIKRAFQKGIFEDISIQTYDHEGKANILINVREKDFIEAISIEGKYSLSKKKIKQLFLLKEEQPLMCNKLEKAIENLRHELEIHGFPNASVRVDLKKLRHPHRVKIILKINTGKPVRIKKIYISGADEKIKNIMKLSEGDIYNQTILKEDLENIRAYYKKNNYINPVVGPYTFTNGILNILIKPGKKLSISVINNDAISTKTILKEMPFSELESFSTDVVEEATHRILSLYHKKGYPFAQVAPIISSTDNQINLHFFIFEGNKFKTDKISFTDNSLYEENLKGLLTIKEGNLFNPDLLEVDREKIENYYIALGYLSAKVKEFQTTYNRDNNTVNVNIVINEGQKTLIEEVVITGARQIPQEELIKTINIKKGDIYNEVIIIDARYRLIDLYHTHGFLKTNVYVTSEIKDNKAKVMFQIKEGQRILFGKTIVVGNYKTKFRVIKRELENKENLPYNYRILTKERRRLYKLGLFSDIDMLELDRYDHKKDVLIKLHEGNPGSVELSLGYAEYERYRGILDVSYRNLWGMNIQPSLRLELSSLVKRFILQYYDPWFRDKPLQFKAFILAEDKEDINIDTKETRYKLTRYSASAGFEKDISDALKIGLFYEFSHVNTYDLQPDVVLSREDTGTLVISGITSIITYDTRDNVFDPRKGILSGISLKITSPLFLSETNFMKLTFHGNIYHSLSKRFVLAASLRGGIAQGYLDTQELPIVERFFLGGRTTVRGYDQDMLGPKGADGNPTGGNAFLMENLELRTYLSKGLGLVVFLDGGNVWLDIKDIDPTDIKFTTGIGLRYKTPVGPLRIDYGHKLQREKGESRGEIHFSIGHAF